MVLRDFESWGIRIYNPQKYTYLNVWPLIYVFEKPLRGSQGFGNPHPNCAGLLSVAAYQRGSMKTFFPTEFRLRIPELIEEGVTGMTFESGNGDDLTGKIRAMFTASFDCNGIAEAAIKQYNAESYYNDIMTIYK